MKKNFCSSIVLFLGVMVTILVTTGCSTKWVLPQTPTQFETHLSPVKIELQQAITNYYAQKYTLAYPSLYRLANAPHYDALAMFYMGEMHLHARGASRSLIQAKEYYKRAFQALHSPARQGYAQYQYALALSYLAGKGTKPDQRKGKQWLEKAAAQNFPLAQVEYGRYLKKRNQNPIPLFTKAATSNDPIAQFLLAQEYFSGQYVPTNPSLATKWLERAAKSNYPPAQYELAVLYSRSVGVPNNQARAVYWYELAASNGNPHSFYALGNAYQRGDGVKQDIIKAYAFYVVGIYLNQSRPVDRNLNADAVQALSLSYNQQLEAEALAKLYINSLRVPTEDHLPSSASN